MPTIEGVTEDLTIEVSDGPFSKTTSIVSCQEEDEEGIVKDADFASETASAAVANQTASAADDEANRPRSDLPQEIISHIEGIWAWGKTVPLLDTGNCLTF